MGLTILGLIVGTLFAIIRGSVKAASEIERTQRENDTITRLIETFRQTFSTLPSVATVTLTITEGSVPPMQELTISGSPRCFGFGINPLSYKDTIIGLRLDPDEPTSAKTNMPRYDLCLSREDLIPRTDENEMAVREDTMGDAAPDEQGRYWMPLLSGVQSLQWRCYKVDGEEWLEEWDDGKWPDLFEMNLTMEGRTAPIRAVFSMPKLQLTQARPASGGGSSPGTTTTTTSQGGGGPQPGGGGAPQSGGGAGGGGR